jgi:hypothetical protein
VSNAYSTPDATESGFFKISHVSPDGVDNARGFIAQARRKLDGFDVVVDSRHRFRAVHADRFDCDPNLVWTRRRNVDFDELKNVGFSRRRKLDRA